MPAPPAAPHSSHRAWSGAAGDAAASNAPALPGRLGRLLADPPTLLDGGSSVDAPSTGAIASAQGPGTLALQGRGLAQLPQARGPGLEQKG
jgi:hypothetical protein